ncbi:hypothetical protein RF11_01412 [Thelohanellus kitauei]|uniref:Uncharacterized protein n=1 Tax=Thelohanellus kitauei TaxID=669202 RepID=A0A0C2ND15_THEKT|nr:hypothetical protein RF11_01412 [Thelohanellus kitauei]
MDRTFQNGEKVLVKIQNPTKLEPLFERPYEIVQNRHPTATWRTENKKNPPQSTHTRPKKRKLCLNKGRHRKHAEKIKPHQERGNKIPIRQSSTSREREAM